MRTIGKVSVHPYTSLGQGHSDRIISFPCALFRVFESGSLHVGYFRSFSLQLLKMLCPLRHTLRAVTVTQE
jgi:hypothetical protein